MLQQYVVVICSNRVICCFHKVILLYARCLDTASIRQTKINRSREDLDVILQLLESDYLKEELQLELDEIAEEIRVFSSKVLANFHFCKGEMCCPYHAQKMLGLVDTFSL